MVDRDDVVEPTYIVTYSERRLEDGRRWSEERRWTFGSQAAAIHSMLELEESPAVWTVAMHVALGGPPVLVERWTR